MPETECVIDEFPWGNDLARLTLTIYFDVSDFHPATRWQDSYGGDISIVGLSVDSALISDGENEREAGADERMAIGRAVMDECADWLVDECAESV